MLNTEYPRDKTDIRRILLAVFAIAAVLSVSFALSDSDNSDAADTDTTRFYYMQLDDFEKAVYDGICNTPVTTDSEGRYEITFDVPIPDAYVNVSKTKATDEIPKKVERAMSGVASERTDIYWLGDRYVTTIPYNEYTELTTSDDITVHIFGLVTEFGFDKSSELRSCLDSIVLDDTDTRQTTVESIHGYLCGLLVYYPDKPIPDTMDTRNVATAFLGDHMVVCEGYAKAFKLLCDWYGIPCLIVTGDAGIGDDKGPHMYNYVQMENEQWYLVDCTFDDQDHGVMTEYLLTGSEEGGFGNQPVKNTHLVDSEKYAYFKLPTLSAESYAHQECEIVFFDYDGSVLSSTRYSHGDRLVIPSDPEKPSTDSETFVFDGWSADGEKVAELPAIVNGTAEYKALFKAHERIYDVRFLDYDGSELNNLKLKFGEGIVPPSGPERESDDYRTYAFSGWYPAVPAKIDNASEEYVFTATYAESANIVTKNGNQYVRSENGSIAFTDAEMAVIKSGTGSLTVILTGAEIEFGREVLDSLIPNETLAFVEKDIDSIDADRRSDFGNAKLFAVDFGANNGLKFPAGSLKISVPVKTDGSDRLELYETVGYTKLGMEYKDGNVVFEPVSFSSFAVTGITEQKTDMGFYFPIVGILVFVVIAMAVAYRFSR